MRIQRLKINHLENPLGYALKDPRISWVVEDTQSRKQIAARVEVSKDETFSSLLFDSGKDETADSLCYPLPIELSPFTRYFYRVTVYGDAGDEATSPVAFFETGRMSTPFAAKWITPAWDDLDKSPLLRKEFNVSKKVVCARAYVTAAGLVHLELNGHKVGDEFFAPGFTVYDQYTQCYTYDITGHITQGANCVGAMLGAGWYKGRFGFEGKANVYGDTMALLCEIVLTYEDGSTTTICSDDTWTAAPSPICDSNLYDGETYDANAEIANWSSPHCTQGTWDAVRILDLPTNHVGDRLGLPIRIIKEIAPVALLTTPSGENVLDMGQNMVGFLRLHLKQPKGSEVFLQVGEALQKGNFFRDNLRSAKAEYHYISDGKERTLMPYFTFYGFRYVKLTQWEGEIDLHDFTGCVVSSTLEETGNIETSDIRINRLFQNALWGQRGNFLDIPTDCPQRDERMGWTGDTQMFSGTACFNMDSAAFFTKFMNDVSLEQKARNGGVPHVVPSAGLGGENACAWADAATVVPMNLYNFYGDKALLAQQYPGMKAWVERIREEDAKDGNHRLWRTGFHFGDWLALDGETSLDVFGGTDVYFVASAFYAYSTTLTAKAARILGHTQDADLYDALAGEVREAICREYLTPNGRLAVPTQTAHVLCLFMDLVPEQSKKRIAHDLRAKLEKDKLHLKTGFVGTPYLCRVLSKYGSEDYAYTLLLNEDLPSWLYAVNMGATTVWERWNSILPDGSFSELGMNSLNHYAYGSIVEWMYRDMIGLNPAPSHAGFRHALIAPHPDKRIPAARATYEAAVGRYDVAWEIHDNDTFTLNLHIPFGATATVHLPYADAKDIQGAAQDGQQATLNLAAGDHTFTYPLHIVDIPPAMKTEKWL